MQRGMTDREKDILIIFDCDGVLIDSEAITSRVELQELRSRGCHLSVEEYQEHALGRTEEEVIWNDIAREWGVLLPDDFAERLRKEVHQALAKELKPIDGAPEVLAVLPYQKCIASGASPGRLAFTLSITGLSGMFEGKCFSGSMVSRGKPAPDVFLYAARAMGYAPSQCLVVEDSCNGVKAAVRAGMTVFGFTGASHCLPGLDRELLGLGCRETFSDLRQLPTLIERNIPLETAV